MVVNSVAICLQSGRLVILCCFQLGNPGGFHLKPCWLFRLFENWDSGDLKAWFALKEYGFKFSLVEKQTAQITRVSLLVGLVSPCCTAWWSFYLWTSGPCWRLELLVLEKRMQAKGRRHSSSQLIGCSVTTRKRRRGGATKQLMECVARVCLYTKEVWAGEALFVVLQDPSAFSRGKRRRIKYDLLE